MRRCPKCGNMESESSRFCSVCGTKMEGAARQNPFRADDEPTVVLNSDQPRDSDQSSNTGNPRAYTEAEKPSPAESSHDRAEYEDRKRGGKGKYIAIIIVLAVLIIAAAAVFITTLTGMNRTDEEVQSGSVVQSDSDLTDIFTEESETADEDASDLIESDAEEDEDEDTEDDASAEEEVTESNSASAVVDDDEQEAEEDTKEEDTEVTSAITSGSTGSDAADSVSGKTYDGVTITTDYVLENSSSAYVKESDLTGLSAQELKIARNEIYARHGRTFNDTELQAYFDSCSWYTGTISPDDFDTDVLNQYELENLSVIRAYETEMGYN